MCSRVKNGGIKKEAKRRRGISQANDTKTREERGKLVKMLEQRTEMFVADAFLKAREENSFSPGTDRGVQHMYKWREIATLACKLSEKCCCICSGKTG